MSSTPLTKKQLKTLAFRAKQKNQAAPVDDVPEVDLLDDDDEAVPVPEPAAEGSKKRKREDDPNGKGKSKEITAEGEEKVDEEKGDDADDAEEQKKKKTKKDVKQRFILFVGNLGFRTTAKQIAVHFKEAVGQEPAVRLLTTKAPAPSPHHPPQAPKSRGIAFIDLPTSTALQAALKMHHSILDGREINVELTAGGGGKSDTRMGKLAERRERVGGQRERKEVEGEGEEGAEGAEKEGGAGMQKKRERGGKRVKNAPKPSEKTDADGKPLLSGWAGRSSGPAPARGSGGRGGRGGGGRGGSRGGNSSRGRGGGGGGGGGRKWEPTGSNAMIVG